MSTGNLPTPYELSRIAAAISGGEAATNYEQAVQRAFALWRAATKKLLDEEAEASGYREEQPPKMPSEREIFVKTREGTSPAMEWIKENAKHPLDKFKTIRAFYNAWGHFQPADASRLKKNIETNLRATEGELRQFLEYRSERRRAHDAARKRETRQNAASKGTSSNEI